MKNLFPSLPKVLIAFIIFISCTKTETAEPAVTLPANIYTFNSIFDIGNNNNASDIRAEVKFLTSATISDISEVRFVLVKTSKTFTENQIKDLKSGNYFVVSTANTEKQIIKPNNNLKDSDGDMIANGVAYNAYMAIVGKGNSYQLSKPIEITLTDKAPLAGDYRGVWNDALFKDFIVTMRIEADYTGKIYYSDNFKACCGGGNDGSVKLVVSGNTISSFEVNQYLGSYKGGHCEAKYTAKGEVQDDIILSISNLTGADCDGEHTPGTVKFTRL